MAVCCTVLGASTNFVGLSEARRHPSTGAQREEMEEEELCVCRGRWGEGKRKEAPELTMFAPRYCAATSVPARRAAWQGPPNVISSTS